MNYAQYKQNQRTITIVDMRHHYDPIGDLTLKGIKKYVSQNKKVGLILNKTGFYTSIMCQDCGEVRQCDQCNLPITIHKANTLSGQWAMCHCCRRVYDVPTQCQSCKSSHIVSRGFGLEQLAEYIKQHTGITPLLIQSNTTNSQRKSQRMYDQRNDHQIIVGTSLVSIGNQVHQFDLLVYVDADQGLSRPDFNAALDTFYGIYEGCKNHSKAHIVLQTHAPQHPLFHYIGTVDESGFTQRDQQYKQQNEYPPFSQICVLMYKHEVEARVYRTIQKLYNEILYLKEYHNRKDIDIYQTPPLLYKKFGKYHYHIILKGKEVRSFMDIVFPLCKIYERGFKVDREPRNLV